MSEHFSRGLLKSVSSHKSYYHRQNNIQQQHVTLCPVSLYSTPMLSIQGSFRSLLKAVRQLVQTEPLLPLSIKPLSTTVAARQDNTELLRWR